MLRKTTVGDGGALLSRCLFSQTLLANWSVCFNIVQLWISNHSNYQGLLKWKKWSFLKHLENTRIEWFYILLDEKYNFQSGGDNNSILFASLFPVIESTQGIKFRKKDEKCKEI